MTEQQLARLGHALRNITDGLNDIAIVLANVSTIDDALALRRELSAVLGTVDGLERSAIDRAEALNV